MKTTQLPETRSTSSGNGAGPGVSVNAGRDRGGSLSTSAQHKLRIPGDMVNKATADLPDEQRSLIRQMHAYYEDHEFSLEELAAKLKQPNGNPYSRDSLYQLLTGRREAGIDNMVAAIKRFLAVTEERKKITKLGFIETALSRKIEKFCGAALTYQKIGFIWGESQIGKTKALEHYSQTHNHGETVMVRVQEGGALNYFLGELATALRMSPQQKIGELRRRIKQAFDDRMLLIVDEIHNCFRNGISREKFRVVEFIREIHDYAHCGVIISGTDLGRHSIFEERLSRTLCVEFRRRGFPNHMQLPRIPTQRDLDTFAEAYGLKPAAGEALDLQTEVINEHGLGVWMTFMQAASKGANKDGEKLQWKHVIKAHAGILALGRMPKED